MDRYALPPDGIQSLVDAAADPVVSLQPSPSAYLLLLYRPNLPPIADVAAAEERLAGFRFNASTHTASRAELYTRLVLQRVDDPTHTPLVIHGMPLTGAPPPPPPPEQQQKRASVAEDGAAEATVTYAGAAGRSSGAAAGVAAPRRSFGYVRWAPDGSRFGFGLYTPGVGVELWVAHVASRTARPVAPGALLNAVCGDPYTWAPGSRSLFVKFVVGTHDRLASGGGGGGRGGPPAARTPAAPHPPPTRPSVPEGPILRDADGGAPAPARTAADTLGDAHDVALFAHYTTAQLAVVDGRLPADGDAGEDGWGTGAGGGGDGAGGAGAPVGRIGAAPFLLGDPAAVRRVSPSPSGRYVLVDAMVPPFAYGLPAGRFPRRVDVRRLDTGAVVALVADVPLQDRVRPAFDAVGEGARNIGWRSDAPATLYWVEAQDGGSPSGGGRAPAAGGGGGGGEPPAPDPPLRNRHGEIIRDAVFTLDAPFTAAPRRLASLAWRFNGLFWGTPAAALLVERRYATRSARSYLLAPGQPPADAAHPDDEDGGGADGAAAEGPCCERACDLGAGEAPRRLVLTVNNWEDRYTDTGSVVTTRNAAGQVVLRLVYPDAIADGRGGFSPNRPSFLMSGMGASDAGDRPFLSLFDTVTGRQTPIWRSSSVAYETVLTILRTDGVTGMVDSLLLRRETPTENPNIYIFDAAAARLRAITAAASRTPKVSAWPRQRQQLPPRPPPPAPRGSPVEAGSAGNAVAAGGATSGGGVVTGAPAWDDDDLAAVSANRDLLTPVTTFPHPAPSMASVTKHTLTYTRDDGVRLRGTLYLPPHYHRGRDGPLPTLLWAYPRDYSTAAIAGQARGSPHRFVRLARTPLYWLTRGYAVLDGPDMPVVAPPSSSSPDSDDGLGGGEDGGADEAVVAATLGAGFVRQLVSSATAAVDHIVRLGVADPTRIAVGGHSYGAFMTATLLAHAPPGTFCAGIARSGAYNRTLTPFGFQSITTTTLWQAPDAYAAMSPYFYAHVMGAPLLLIHGAADGNAGTAPMQSERLFEALKGHGKVARLVLLPAEAHGYRARESVLHVLAEMDAWLEKYCKRGGGR